MLVDHAHRLSHDARFPSRWVEKAVALAMEQRWEEAVALNKRILATAPDDLGALNRLGRALMELGQYDGATEAYTKTLRLSPSNAIAEKNLARLAALPKEMGPAVMPAKADLNMFLAEPGKATITTIKLGGEVKAPAKIAVGEQVSLVIAKRALQVHDARGALLGTVEQRLARRIIDLMNGGNRYDAALVSTEDDAARVVIRETYQDPSQLGKVSFPAPEASPLNGGLKQGLQSDDIDEEESEDAAEDAEETVAGTEEEQGGDNFSEDRFLA